MTSSIPTLYWRRVRLLTLTLLLVWLGITSGVIFFARELSVLNLFGWPVPFYMAAQGMTLVYLLIIGVYALVMNKLDALARSEPLPVSDHHE